MAQPHFIVVIPGGLHVVVLVSFPVVMATPTYLAMAGYAAGA